MANFKRDQLKIAFLDLNHMTVGVHTNTVPLGTGLIAYYLKSCLNCKFDIRIFKNHNDFLKTLKNWQPDVLGIAQYVWNSELNLHIAKLVKMSNPDCLIVAGGPNLYLSAEEKSSYLKEHNYIDTCVSYDGEIPFTGLVSRFLNGETTTDIRNAPEVGTYSISALKGGLVEPSGIAPRLKSLDIFKSVYRDGFFDSFLNDGFHPFLQTQRGCPFKCAYCHTGDDYYSRMIFQPAEYFKQEMDYLGKRFAGRHNIILYLANTNFGLYKEDFEIARIIRQSQDKFDWPKNINVNFASKPDKLLELVSILKYKFVPAISLQTLTPGVLKKIHRKNIPIRDFKSFQKKVIKDIGENPSTELILSLPGETKKSFLKTVTKVLNSGVQDITIYTLMSLKGTPIASKETASRYGFQIKHRLVPRSFSEVNGEKVFDIEQVVVGTKTLPFKDYLYLRGLALVIFTFSSSIELFPVRKLLMEHRIAISKWILRIHSKISRYKSLRLVYDEFLRATKNELFSSPQDLNEFFNNKKNYELLFSGKLGDNLLRRYRTEIISKHFKEFLELALNELQFLAKRSIDAKTLAEIIKELKLFIQSRDIGEVFEKGYDENLLKTVSLKYDIPGWAVSKESNKRINDFKGKYSYSMHINNYMRKRLKDFRLMNRDAGLSLQILYRDGYIKDFWPLWSRNRR